MMEAVPSELEAAAQRLLGQAAAVRNALAVNVELRRRLDEAVVEVDDAKQEAAELRSRVATLERDLAESQSREAKAVEQARICKKQTVRLREQLASLGGGGGGGSGGVPAGAAEASGSSPTTSTAGGSSPTTISPTTSPVLASTPPFDGLAPPEGRGDGRPDGLPGRAKASADGAPLVSDRCAPLVARSRRAPSPATSQGAEGGSSSGAGAAAPAAADATAAATAASQQPALQPTTTGVGSAPPPIRGRGGGRCGGGGRPPVALGCGRSSPSRGGRGMGAVPSSAAPPPAAAAAAPD